MSQFYLSLEDDLMKRFGSDTIKSFLDRMKIGEEDAVIQSKMLTKQVESAQKRVEGNNYDTRKNVLQYDDVMREQREVIYKQRTRSNHGRKKLIQATNEHGQTDNQSCSRCAYTIRERKLEFGKYHRFCRQYSCP